MVCMKCKQVLFNYTQKTCSQRSKENTDLAIRNFLKAAIMKEDKKRGDKLIKK